MSSGDFRPRRGCLCNARHAHRCRAPSEREARRRKVNLGSDRVRGCARIQVPIQRRVVRCNATSAGAAGAGHRSGDVFRMVGIVPPLYVLQRGRIRKGVTLRARAAGAPAQVVSTLGYELARCLFQSAGAFFQIAKLAAEGRSTSQRIMTEPPACADGRVQYALRRPTARYYMRLLISPTLSAPLRRCVTTLARHPDDYRGSLGLGSTSRRGLWLDCLGLTSSPTRRCQTDAVVVRRLGRHEPPATAAT
jgi:hypothetical protein